MVARNAGKVGEDRHPAANREWSAPSLSDGGSWQRLNNRELHRRTQVLSADFTAPGMPLEPAPEIAQGLDRIRFYVAIPEYRHLQCSARTGERPPALRPGMAGAATKWLKRL
jgi:hypothetical protein